MKKNWFYIITPCILGAAFSLLIVIDGLIEMNSSNGWSMLAVYIFSPLLLGLLIAVFFIKKIVSKKPEIIWIAEIIIIAIIIILFNIYKA